jgi:hypothetical protein
MRPDDDPTWPALPYATWKSSLDTLHMWMQVVGKVKLALTPFLNDWWNVTFQATARGLTTSTIPVGQRVFQVDWDFIGHRLSIETSDGRSREMPLAARTVADFYAEFMSHLDALDVHVKISTTPVEVDDGIPFEQDRVHAQYDPEYVTRWWRVLLATNQVLQRYRTPFAGKSSPVHFWWGSFDLSTTRYCGRSTPPREWPTRWMALAAEWEQALAGFWPGNMRFPEPAFVAYTTPAPDGFKDAAVEPEAASFSEALGEFVLPYAAVRDADDPASLILRFYNSAYAAGANLAGWDRAALERPAYSASPRS